MFFTPCSIRAGLTNRDYLWAAAVEARESLGTIVAAFERVHFGRRVATAESFQQCALAYQKTFAAPGEGGAAGDVG